MMQDNVQKIDAIRQRIMEKMDAFNAGDPHSKVDGMIAKMK